MLKPAGNGMTFGMMGDRKGDHLNAMSATRKPNRSRECRHCGAWCGHLGLEPTVPQYIDHLVAVFAEVKRVLRSDGTCWLNIGDAYLGSAQDWSKNKIHAGDKQATNRGNIERMWLDDYGYARPPGHISSRQPDGGKPLDLAHVPQQLSLRLRSDGWYVRSWIIWYKTTCKPESVAGWRWERHKIKVSGGQRGREPYRVGATPDRPQQDHHGKGFLPSADWVPCPGCRKCHAHDGLILRRGTWRPTTAHDYILILTKTPTAYGDGDAVRQVYAKTTIERADGSQVTTSGANLRTVLTLGPEPYREAHFATFPTAIPNLAIRASTSEKGVCATCGALWARILSKQFIPQQDVSVERGIKGAPGQKPMDESSGWDGVPRGSNATTTLGWKPTCHCPSADPVPAIVLDVFGGSGTVGQVCERLGRRWISVDLAYHDLAKARTAQRGLALT